jgi:hypothetical protein
MFVSLWHLIEAQLSLLWVQHLARGKECGRNVGRLVNRYHEKGGPLHIVEPRAAVDIVSGAGP